MKTVLVDRENCIGCENCTLVCSQVFEMREGKSSPKNPVDDGLIADVDMAIAQCPVQVISWSEV